MNIKTKHNISIEIDDIAYKVTVSEMTKDIKEKLENSSKQRALEFEEIDNLNFALAEMEEEYKINESILKEGTVSDKSKVWFEQKALNKKIFELRKKINESKKTTQTLHVSIEKYFEEAFDLCVKGENAVTLKNKIDEVGLSYSVIFDNIKKLIARSLEKK